MPLRSGSELLLSCTAESYHGTDWVSLSTDARASCSPALHIDETPSANRPHDADSWLDGEGVWPECVCSWAPLELVSACCRFLAGGSAFLGSRMSP